MGGTAANIARTLTKRSHVLPLPRGEEEPLGSFGRVECTKAFGRAGVGRAALAASFDGWHRSQHSPNLDEAFARSPSPQGRGGTTRLVWKSRVHKGVRSCGRWPGCLGGELRWVAPQPT